MAAVGSLVGLFSKNAVEKLRELFNTLFQTEDALSTELLSRLPPDLKKAVGPYLKTRGSAETPDGASPDAQVRAPSA